MATPTTSEGRLEAIEARLEHLARSLETRLDALERSVKAARVEARGAGAPNALVEDSDAARFNDVMA